MNENQKVIVQDAPALGISVRCAAGECELVFQTHVAQDTGKTELDALVDRLTAVAARQKAKVTLDELKRHRKSNVVQLERMREDRTRVEAMLSAPQEGRRNQDRNADTLKKQRETADANEKRFRDIIREADEEIRAQEALIAGG